MIYNLICGVVVIVALLLIVFAVLYLVALLTVRPLKERCAGCKDAEKRYTDKDTGQQRPYCMFCRYNPAWRNGWAHKRLRHRLRAPHGVSKINPLQVRGG